MKVKKGVAHRRSPSPDGPTAGFNDGVAHVKKALTELAAIDIATPENAPKAVVIYTRMLLLDFVACAAGVTRPEGVYAATQRASAYFTKTKRSKKEMDAFLWAVGIFSELHNCRQFVDAHIESTTLLLDTIRNATPVVEANTGVKWAAYIKWKDDNLFARVNMAVYDTVNYIKAYNLTMDIAGELSATPEMILAKKRVDDIIHTCEACNKARGENTILLNELTNAPPPDVKTTLKRGIESSGATLLSMMITAYINLTEADSKAAEARREAMEAELKAMEARLK